MEVSGRTGGEGNHNFPTIRVKAASGKNHQQIPNLGVKYDKHICMILIGLLKDAY